MEVEQQKPKWQKARVNQDDVQEFRGKEVWVRCAPPFMSTSVDSDRHVLIAERPVYNINLLDDQGRPMVMDFTRLELLPEFKPWVYMIYYRDWTKGVSDGTINADKV